MTAQQLRDPALAASSLSKSVEADPTRPAAREWLAFAALTLCALAFWLVQESYAGLVHDSVLYTFTALARIHPESLTNDVFLRFGSQDQYTIFSPIYAAAIRQLGLEPAAALLTLVSHAAIFGSAWLLARRLMSPVQALLAVGLLITLPSVYGSEHKFAYTEAFLTPRLPAEALVLAALAAALARRFAVAMMSVLGALLLHPLMAVPGVFMLLVMSAEARWQTSIWLSSAGAFAGVVILSVAVPFGPVAPFDPAWFDLLHSGMHYLFPSLWALEDWAHACVPIAQLAVGWMTATRPELRRVYRAALLTGAAGVAVTLIGSDLLHIQLIAQIQCWRWLWLTTCVAVLVIPLVAAECWQRGTATRAAALLLAAAWVCVDERFAPVIATLSVGVAAAANRITAGNHRRLLLFGACGVLLIGVLLFVGTVVSVVEKVARIPPDTTLYDSPYLLWLRGVRPWVSGGIVPACILLLVWWSVAKRNWGAIAIALSIGMCLAFAPLALRAWTRTVFPEELRAQFSAWRREIPLETQVFWIDSPLGPWYILERSSYWTAPQTAGVVFSRGTAMELARRERLLKSQPVRERPQQNLEDLCRADADLGYVVIERDLGPTPFPTVPFRGEHLNGLLRLYRCADHRG